MRSKSGNNDRNNNLSDKTAPLSTELENNLSIRDVLRKRSSKTGSYSSNSLSITSQSSYNDILTPSGGNTSPPSTVDSGTPIFNTLRKDDSSRSGSLSGEYLLSNKIPKFTAAELNETRKESVESKASEKHSKSRNKPQKSLNTEHIPEYISIDEPKSNGSLLCRTVSMSTVKSCPSTKKRPLRISELLTDYNSELLEEVPLSEKKITVHSKSYKSFRQSYKNITEPKICQKHVTGATGVHGTTSFQSSYEKWKSTTSHRPFGNGFERKPLSLSGDSSDSGDENGCQNFNKDIRDNYFVAKISYNESETESESGFSSEERNSKDYSLQSFVAVISAGSDSEEDSSTSEDISPSNQRHTSLNSPKSHGLFINSGINSTLCAQVVPAKKPFFNVRERKLKQNSLLKEKVLDRRNSQIKTPPAYLIIDQPKEEMPPSDPHVEKEEESKKGFTTPPVKRTSNIPKPCSSTPSPATPSPNTQKRLKLKLYKPITIKPCPIDSNSPERNKPRKHSKSSRENTPQTSRKESSGENNPQTSRKESSGESNPKKGREKTPQTSKKERDSTPQTSKKGGDNTPQTSRKQGKTAPQTGKECQSSKSCGRTKTGSIQERIRSIEESLKTRGRKEVPIVGAATDKRSSLGLPPKTPNSVRLPPKTPKCRRVRHSVDTTGTVDKVLQGAVLFND